MEVEPRPRRSQADRTDRLIGYSAMFISLLALVVSVIQVRQTDLANRANAWPSLSIDVSTSEQLYRLTLNNSGTGPSILKSFSYTHLGKPLQNFRALMPVVQCEGHTSESSFPVNTVVPSGANWVLFEYKSDSTDCALKFQNQVVIVRAVYCSIYDDCWELTDTIGGHTPQIRPVPKPD